MTPQSRTEALRLLRAVRDDTRELFPIGHPKRQEAIRKVEQLILLLGLEV